MKKITLLVLTMLFSAITYAQKVFPTVSTPGNEVWYYIQFERPGGSPAKQGVIQDMGEGASVLTKQARLDTDAQLWKVTGSQFSYKITNKLGRSLAFSGGLYKAAAASTLGVSIDNSANTTYPNGYEIYGSSKWMNQNGGGGFERTLGEYNQGDQGNVLNFRLAADVVGGLEPKLVSVLPTVGTSYHIKFRNGNGVLTDMGAGNLVNTTMPREGDTSQLWKISGTPGDYTLTSDSGNILDWDGAANHFTAKPTSTVKFALIENVPGFELQRVGGLPNNTMNQDGSQGYGKTLTEYFTGDQGSPLDFVKPGTIAYFPKMSSGGTDYWYRIQFNSSAKGAINDQGADVNLLTVAAAADDLQLWKATGTETAFTLTNKATGRSIAVVGGKYTSSLSSSVTFKVVLNADATLFNLQAAGNTQGINQVGGGTAIGKELGNWTLNDPNNVLKFVSSSTPLSVAKVDASANINVYPNPFQDYFYFNVKNTAATNATLKVYTISGNLVKSGTLALNKGEVMVDGRDLARGMYIVQIETTEGSSNFKMIKQ